MKKILLILLCSLMPLLGSAQEQGKAIRPEKLPEAALTTIKKHFQQAEISQVLKQKRSVYQVLLSDSTTLRFNKKGQCFTMKNTAKGLPASVIPEKILESAAQKYPDVRMVRIAYLENGYRILFANNQVLGYDRDGVLTGEGYEGFVHENGKTIYKSSYTIHESRRE